MSAGEDKPITTPTAPVEKEPDMVEQGEEKEPAPIPDNEPEKAPEKEVETTPEKPATQQQPTETEPTRTPEQELVDKELIMLLREQLAGAYDTKGATFTFTCNEELESKECFAYEMKKDGVCEIFAVAVDSSAIFHLEGMEFVKIFG